MKLKQLTKKRQKHLQWILKLRKKIDSKKSRLNHQSINLWHFKWFYSLFLQYFFYQFNVVFHVKLSFHRVISSIKYKIHKTFVKKTQNMSIQRFHEFSKILSSKFEKHVSMNTRYQSHKSKYNFISIKTNLSKSQKKIQSSHHQKNLTSHNIVKKHQDYFRSMNFFHKTRRLWKNYSL